MLLRHLAAAAATPVQTLLPTIQIFKNTDNLTRQKHEEIYFCNGDGGGYAHILFE